ncbi:restriction endonuclease [Rhodoferax aquaticus]|uniref:Restriction endonuclease n=1 Tax=Rhodoferax aquaticus TaxID=2527691 RepID=A0A515EQW6_9BURK|nr:restriction endonuclease [Rhodoferax aquaticus]QDL55051.1 restriction endonuclease [Rhodoferax aquaticus]
MGVTVSLLGAAMLFGPQLLGNSAIGLMLAKALMVPGVLLLTAGLVMLAYSSYKSRTPSLPKFKGSLSTRPAPFYATKPAPLKSSPPSESNVIEVEFRGRHLAKAGQLAQKSLWSKAVFASIEWRRFEAVCEALFAQAGFETKSQSHGADGGVDIWLHSRNAKGPAAVVQCKHWQGKPVGVKEMREFFGVMASHGLKRGTYATTSTFTEDAVSFAKANGINALDGRGLLALIAKRSPEQQKALLDVAYEGDYWRPTCASCGVKMLERKPRAGGSGFWGCSNFPRCKSRLPMA